MKKQSSIEWLIEELNKSTSLTSFVPECSDDYKKEILGIIDQAKEMHKQEIIEARLVPLNMFKELREKHGYFGGHDNGQVIDREINDSEYYYKNTYEKEN